MNKIKSIILTLSLLILSAIQASAQDMPVHFTVQQKQVSPTEVQVVFSALIDKGWHVYSTNLPGGGPTPATLHLDKSEGVTPVGKLTFKGKEISKDDNMFGMKLRFFENSVSFIQKFNITAKTYRIKGYLNYSACNDEMCMPPTNVEFNYSGKGPQDAPAALPAQEKGDSAATAAPLLTVATDSVKTDSVAPLAASQVGGDLWKPVVKELAAQTDLGSTSNRSLWYIFLMGLLGGFVALLTPCVWPIIPMTVSFFLKRSKDDKKRGIRDAVTYGISIVVIYMLLALLITTFFGPQRLNDLATNAPFNIFFFLLLVVFAFSFFGWFELTLPSSWGNAVDSKAEKTTGLLSIFLMAFTLSLVSFSCTAPIVGLLLVEAATSGDWLAPTMGMLGFAIALALPFSLFALFPAWLKQAPKSGSWMNVIKVVLGFIELAFAFKFFSVADLAYGWHLLDREVFLSIWIALFLLMSLYLTGLVKFPHDDQERRSMPVPCIMLGLASLAFAIYMIPGLWGAPCKAVSAFAPPMNTQDFNLNTHEVRAAYTNYEEGMAAAAKAGKPVMLDFTGFGCVNCRKMEAAVWTDPNVAKKLNEDYVLISLFVDDKTPLAKPMEVTDTKGKQLTLRTVGDKWSYLEQTKFGYLAQPFYVCVDNQGNPLSGSFVYKEDIPGYLDFLDKGIAKYRESR